MICPKWLVQASAVGVFGAAVVTAPLVVDSDDRVDDETTTIVYQTTVEQADRLGEATADEATHRVDAHLETTRNRAEEAANTARVHQLRHSLNEQHVSTRCRPRIETRQSDSVDAGRSAVDRATEKARDRAETDDSAEPVDRLGPLGR